MKHIAGLVIGMILLGLWALPGIVHAPLERRIATEPVVETMQAEGPSLPDRPATTSPIVEDAPSVKPSRTEPNIEALVSSTTVASMDVAPQTPLYHTEPLADGLVNERARSALINILCIGTPPMKSTSGTGVLVSADGMIITNAHIGQYVLLADSGAPLSCFARIGSPAQAEWQLETVYLPPSWAAKYAPLLFAMNARGTGEDDYAILRIVRGEAEHHDLSSLTIDTRAEALSTGPLLISAYPAEFMSGSEVQRYLNVQSTHVMVRELYTYGTSSIDAVSLGSSPLAQQGSSGGALVNPWGYLVGLITTTTEGENTGSRDLRAITLGHVARSLADRGIELMQLISREPSAWTAALSQTRESLRHLEAALP